MPKPPRPSTRLIVYWSIFVPSGSSAGSCPFIARIPKRKSGGGRRRNERSYLYQFWQQRGARAAHERESGACAWVARLVLSPQFPGLGLYALLRQHNMRVFSCEMGVARMPGARRHRLVAGAIVMLLSSLASGAPLAQDAKLLADCAGPQRVADPTDAAPGAAPIVTATVSCEVRSTDAVVFKGVKVNVKGRSE